MRACERWGLSDYHWLQISHLGGVHIGSSTHQTLAHIDIVHIVQTPDMGPRD